MILPLNDNQWDSKSTWWLDTDSIFLSKENWEKLLFYTRGKHKLCISIETLYNIVGLNIVFYAMSTPNNINKFKELYEMYSILTTKTKSKLWKN